MVLISRKQRFSLLPWKVVEKRKIKNFKPGKQYFYKFLALSVDKRSLKKKSCSGVRSVGTGLSLDKS